MMLRKRQSNCPLPTEGGRDREAKVRRAILAASILLSLQIIWSQQTWCFGPGTQDFQTSQFSSCAVWVEPQAVSSRPQPGTSQCEQHSNATLTKKSKSGTMDL